MLVRILILPEWEKMRLMDEAGIELQFELKEVPGILLTASTLTDSFKVPGT